jgi:hypothetical protein
MLKKLFVVLLMMLLLFTGCSSFNAPDIRDENISPAAADKAEDAVAEQSSQPTQEADQNQEDSATSLQEKMAIIGFEEVSGYYTRKAFEEDTEYMEMFSFEKNTFIRITTSDVEREVFAYNYKSDDFTYIYYFDGEIAAKTVINVGTGAVMEDEEGYAEFLTLSADELKIYFNSLLEAAGLVPDDLH